mmetsp:Transcript_38659/g.115487  ORF Transcript_38659/g.115487 Transcript_38659/m.115487 type:complete len:241 (+) Transcript_38659:608-1330(+)
MQSRRPQLREALRRRRAARRPGPAVAPPHRPRGRAPARAMLRNRSRGTGGDGSAGATGGSRTSSLALEAAGIATSVDGGGGVVTRAVPRLAAGPLRPSQGPPHQPTPVGHTRLRELQAARCCRDTRTPWWAPTWRGFGGPRARWTAWAGPFRGRHPGYRQWPLAARRPDTRMGPPLPDTHRRLADSLRLPASPRRRPAFGRSAGHQRRTHRQDRVRRRQVAPLRRHCQETRSQPSYLKTR